MLAAQRSQAAPSAQPVAEAAQRASSAPTPNRSYLAPSTPALRLGPGEPLRPQVQKRLQTTFGADFSAVRVHNGPDANAAADAISARAFAYGTSIVLGSNQRPDDMALIGHEAVHVLQQRGVSATQKFSASPAADPLEAEAARGSGAVVAGAAMSVQGSVAPRVQRGVVSWVEGKASGAVDWVEDKARGAVDWVEDKIWGLLEKHAPELVPIIRKGPEGVLDWLKDRITAGIEALFNTLMAPVRVITGAGHWLSAQFAPLLAWMQDAAAKIARNDCSPLREAAAKIEKVATSIITPIVEKIQSIAGKVGDFFKGLWNKFGAPVWDWIKEVAGEAWEKIKSLANWIWDKTEPIRNWLARAWRWIKNKLGVGEGPEGHNGILQWVQGKLSSAWDWILKKIEPYKKQLMIVAAVIGGLLLLVSPAGPVLIIGGIVVGIIQGVRWIQANWGRSNMVVRAREFLEKTLFPPFIGAINRFSAAVNRMAQAINSKLADVTAGLGRMVGAVASSILRFAVAAAQWLADQFVAVAQWGVEKLQGLAHWISEGLSRLLAFLRPVLEFFAKVGRLLFDIWSLPFLLAGKLWNLIPSCIRDPFIDWIVPLILRQIDIFKELVKDNEAWQKTKADVMHILHLVFVTHDLKGAIKATFHLILRVFNVPIELLMQVLRKAATAWDVVTAAPIRFIKNCVRAVGMGLKKYWDHLWDNFLEGVEGWLFGEVADKGITKPNSWTNPWDLLEFGLQIMGLSMNHVFDLMERKFSKETVDKLRVWYGRLSKVWDWIMEMRGKKPAEVTQSIIENVKGFGKTILEGIVTWVVQSVSVELAEMAAAAAASAGLSEVLDAIRRIYRAIKTAVRWMRQVLEMLNRAMDSVLNIAAGILEPGAVLLEKAMKLGTPAIIGFLADQVGLGSVGEKIREIIDSLRAKVDAAILAILDRLKAFFEAIAQGARKLLAWWLESREVKVGDAKAKVYFQGGESSAQLMISSSPGQSYTDYLTSVAGKMKSQDQKDAHAAALKLGVSIDSRIHSHSMTDAEGKALVQDLNRMATYLRAILGGSTDPPSIITYGPLTAEQGATEANAQILSQNDGGSHGTTPADEPPIWTAVRLRRSDEDKRAYVQGHLLNHNLHGPGKRFNLAPITYSANSDHKLGIEAKMKELVLDDDRVVSYRIKAVYGSHYDGPAYLALKGKSNRSSFENKQFLLMQADRKLPTQFEFKAATLKQQGGKWVTDAAVNYGPVKSEIPQHAPNKEELQ